MTDEDGDNVFEVFQFVDTTEFDTILYKFINGNAWGYPHDLLNWEMKWGIEFWIFLHFR